MEAFAVPASILGLAAGTGAARWAVAGLDLGPLPAGLYRGDGAGWLLALAAADLRGRGLPSGACLQTVSQAPDGRAWIGASAGLFAWQPGAAIARETSLGDPDVRAVLALADDILIAGTAGALYAGAPGHLGPVEDWSGQAVNVLAWDASAETLWCGTDAGLVQVGRTPAGWRVEATSTVTNSGLAADRVTALALSGDADGAKTVWAGTPNGISRYQWGI
jgi:ligand-binding sensor domain-containing protein